MQRRLAWITSYVDPRPIGIARILVGIAVFGKLLIVAPNLVSVLSGEYVRQSYPVQVPIVYDDQFAYAVCMLWLVSSVLFLLGYLTRFAGTALALAMVYVMLIDQQLYSNHHYLMVLVVTLLTLGNCGARYSVDSWRSGGLTTAVPGWPQTLLKLQLTSVYGFAAITKINSDFLSGVIFEGWVNPSAIELMREYGNLTIFAIAAIGFELFLAVAFWSRTVRWVALPLGIGFHMTLVWVMGASVSFDFIVFAIVMCAMYLQFYGDVFARLASAAGARARITAAEHAT